MAEMLLFRELASDSTIGRGTLVLTHSNSAVVMVRRAENRVLATKSRGFADLLEAIRDVALSTKTLLNTLLNALQILFLGLVLFLARK